MNILFALLTVIAVLSVIALAWDVRFDGHRARPIDPELHRRLRTREESRRAALEDAQAAAAAAHSAPVPPELATWRIAPHVATRRPRIRAQRVRH